jgi:hypothetical protein
LNGRESRALKNINSSRKWETRRILSRELKCVFFLRNKFPTKTVPSTLDVWYVSNRYHAVSCSVISTDIMKPHICRVISSISYVTLKSAWFFCYQIGLNGRWIIKRVIKNHSLVSPVASYSVKWLTVRSQPLPPILKLWPNRILFILKTNHLIRE